MLFLIAEIKKYKTKQKNRKPTQGKLKKHTLQNEQFINLQNDIISYKELITAENEKVKHNVQILHNNTNESTHVTARTIKSTFTEQVLVNTITSVGLILGSMFCIK
jgi:hypothetical protein